MALPEVNVPPAFCKAIMSSEQSLMVRAVSYIQCGGEGVDQVGHSNMALTAWVGSGRVGFG